MSENKWWLTDDTSLDKPNPARVYDYFLGGFHNFEADRMVADGMIQAYPEVQRSAQIGRACLRRCINFLVAQGMDQFLDVGSGLPTLGNVHQVAQAANPAARVAYVDIDPVAVAHGKGILKDNPNAIYIRGDVARPDEFLNHEEIRNLLDLSRPVALVLFSTLVYITDDEAAHRVVCTLRDAMAPGSFIVITHATFDASPPGVVERLSKLYARSTTPNRVRTHAEILQFFDEFELVEPGLVHIPLWRPDEPDDESIETLGVTGVGRLPVSA